ncbi:MAG: 3-oxo-5-alpha-steroid 4-dehydrogenase [Deltaproteobacteria bacterium]|nr:3-oxo-5-alpha-steroid 4-dehydrogenase [Deltaproteobacteria bacterium]
MTEPTFYSWLLWGMFAVAAGTAIFSVFVPAPYGRYGRTWWSGPDLPSWLAWMLMELPQPVGLGLWFALGDRQGNTVALVLLAMWMFHYAYRTLIYPFIPRSSTMSLSVVALGFLLNSGFSYLIGRWIFHFGPARGVEWLWDPRFLGGTLCFFGGFALSVSSDLILRGLRKPGEKGYKIPRGGGFRFVTSPNYLGELLEWTGWTLVTWSLGSATLLAVSAANLVPRARRNHRWYHERFPDYPSERKALVPFVW